MHLVSKEGRAGKSASLSQISAGLAGLAFLRCRAVAGVEAANNELAGAEAGDGRDESNRSLQERLADAQNAQVGQPCASNCTSACWLVGLNGQYLRAA